MEFPDMIQVKKKHYTVAKSEIEWSQSTHFDRIQDGAGL